MNGVGDWLRRIGVNGGPDDLENVKEAFIKNGMKENEIKGYILDIDTTRIKEEKGSALKGHSMP